MEGALQAAAHAAVGVRPEGQRRGLEACRVMPLEEFGHQVGGGMLVQVGRQVGHADALVPVTLAAPQRLRRGRIKVGCVNAAALVLQSRGV